MKNILLIRLSSLGDIVLTSPAIRAVRQHFPQGAYLNVSGEAVGRSAHGKSSYR